MKAIITTAYGPPSVLELQELPKPIPKDNEILVRLHAATVTAGDCELRGSTVHPLFWLPVRLMIGVFKPSRVKVFGQEWAGVVEAVGSAVSHWKVGDEIFGPTGMEMGSYAEYLIRKDSDPIGRKPKNMSFGEAASLVVGGINSLHFLRKANIQPGQQVMIYGSTGSIGSYAIQLAKYYGAEVTAVCGTPNVQLMKDWGVDHVFDYMTEDWADGKVKYDVLLEAVGKTSWRKGMRIIKKGGMYLLANPKTSYMFASLVAKMITGKRVVAQAAGESNADLAFLARLVEEGHLKSMVDRSFDLEDMVAAHEYIDKGQKVGNVLINIQ